MAATGAMVVTAVLVAMVGGTAAAILAGEGPMVEGLAETVAVVTLGAALLLLAVAGLLAAVDLLRRGGERQ